MFEIINILEDDSKKNIIVRLFLWVKNKIVNSNGSKDCVYKPFKYSDYEFLLDFYKSYIVDKFACKYTLTDKQIEYIGRVLGECDYDKYEEVLDELTGVFGLVEVESKLSTKLYELGLEINISSLDCY